MSQASSDSAGARHLPFESSGRVAAAIDLGTQTALLLIAERSEAGGFDVLEDHALSARLGAGLVRRGALEDEAIDRTLEILGHFQRRVAQHGVAPEAFTAVGTAVLRRAPDASRFLDRARAELGMEIEVISGEEEARLGFQAVRTDPGNSARPSDGSSPGDLALIDLGGGSVEVVSEEGERRRSFPFGAVTATEEFGFSGHDSSKAGESLDRALAEALSSLEPLGPGARVVAIGGTASNLACLVSGQVSFDPRLADGREVTTEAALEWSERLQGLDLEARRDFAIEPDRAEILPAGLRILGRVLEQLGSKGARVSGRGLRHALVARLLAP